MKRTLLPALAATSLLALSACGTSQPTTETSGSDTSESSGSAGPITLTDAAGRTVELDAPAERVVVLEWQMVEDVLTLGLEPVGVADVEGYTTWNSSMPLDPDTQDVGKRGEPNLDAIYATDPDLVITEVYGPDDAVVEQLEEYDVPVLATLGADTEDPIGQMEETLDLIAQATGREDEADAAMADFEAALEEGRAAIEAADPETTEFAFFDAYAQGSTVAVRPFGQGSWIGEIGEALGLTNVWEGEVDAAYGLGSTDVEGLAEVDDALVLHTATQSETWLPQLAENRVWTNADFVEEDRLRAFPEGVWTFGGPRSGEQVVDAFVAAVTG